MAKSRDSTSPIDGYITEIESLRTAISRLLSVKVNSQTLKNRTKQAVRKYFTDIRATLETTKIDDEVISSLDTCSQELNQLLSNNNRKTSYLRVLNDLRTNLSAVDLEYHKAQGKHGSNLPVSSELERRIISTLEKMVPTAALSYQQALLDLSLSAKRVSFRGTANELRECLRETVDHMAPDSDVMKDPGYKHEPNLTKPTQRQKIRHILKSRKTTDTAWKAPIDTANAVEITLSNLGRSIFERTNLATHVASARYETRRLKMYVDVLLCELLEVDV